MILKRNLLETLTIVSCSGTFICISLHYVTNISLITGVWFHLYILALFLGSVTLSFKLIQQLLLLNKPLKYDLEGLAEKYPYLKVLWDVLPRVPKRVEQECEEYDTNELSVISTVLERRLVSSWYIAYVSEEIGFPFGCKQMFDQMIGTCFQICNKMEAKDVYIDICSILTTHLKEYKKAMKRHEKSPDTPIEALYKRSHPISNSDKKHQSAEHCTNLLRMVLKELVPWELWDTPQSELLVRILSKKLDYFIDDTLADPEWLNDMLLTILEGSQLTEETDEKTEESQDTDPTPKVEDSAPEVAVEAETISMVPVLPSVEPLTTIPAMVLQPTTNGLEALEEETIERSQEVAGSAPVDIHSSPVLRQRRGRRGRDEVKIYDRIIEGSVKTWESHRDLQCISLGQDLLESLNGDEITLNRLWGQDPQDSDSSKDRLWFSEEDQLDMELDNNKQPSPVKKDSNPKPTDLLLKDLQSTVHHAKSKIGDLQVSHSPHVTVNDEAAGMMEGLLDFGIAGLKKGLRLTGLGDDTQELMAGKEKSLEKTPPPEVKNKTETKDILISTTNHKEENSNSAPVLVKQQRVSSQDSVALTRPQLKEEFGAPLLPLNDSPEPEYEEAADLSTSIAKLRCLLQQRADNSRLEREGEADEIWWEGAEETRGRAQRHHSGRPVDTATLADEYDMSERLPANNMQRLDSLFQRTVTGVLNSLKTAVGGEGEGDTRGERVVQGWTYVCTSTQLSVGVGVGVARLVGSRRARSRPRALPRAAPSPPHTCSAAPLPADVTPDDLEEWVGEFGAGWGGSAALGGAAGLPRQHLAQRIATILFADVSESLIEIYLSSAAVWLRHQIFASFERQAERPHAKPKPLRAFNPEETCAAIINKLPGAVIQVFGSEAIQEAVQLLVRSVSSRPVNKDVALRMLDVLALHFSTAAGTVATH